MQTENISTSTIANKAPVHGSYLTAPALLAVGLALGWLYLPTILQLGRAWQTDEYYSHGWFVPFVCLGLLWLQRDALTRAWAQKSPPRMPILFIIGLALEIFGTLADVNFIRAVSLPIVLLGIGHYIAGWEYARHLRFALFYFVLAIPFSRILTQMFTVPMQNSAASFAGLMMGLCGMPIERDGVNLYTPHYHFVVAVPCSGLKTSISLFTMAILLAHLMPGLRNYQRVALSLLSLPLSLIVNSLRIVIIVLLGHYCGKAVAEGFLHGFSGVLVFGLSLGLLFLLGDRLMVVNVKNSTRPLINGTADAGVSVPTGTP